MAGSHHNKGSKKHDPVPFWIMGALVLLVIFIVWYGP
jgi:hypothetical protein